MMCVIMYVCTCVSLIIVEFGGSERPRLSSFEIRHENCLPQRRHDLIDDIMAAKSVTRVLA